MSDVLTFPITLPRDSSLRSLIKATPIVMMLAVLVILFGMPLEPSHQKWLQIMFVLTLGTLIVSYTIVTGAITEIIIDSSGVEIKSVKFFGINGRKSQKYNISDFDTVCYSEIYAAPRSFRKFPFANLRNSHTGYYIPYDAYKMATPKAFAKTLAATLGFQFRELLSYEEILNLGSPEDESKRPKEKT